MLHWVVIDRHDCHVLVDRSLHDEVHFWVVALDRHLVGDRLSWQETWIFVALLFNKLSLPLKGRAR